MEENINLVLHKALKHRMYDHEMAKHHGRKRYVKQTKKYSKKRRRRQWKSCLNFFYISISKQRRMLFF